VFAIEVLELNCNSSSAAAEYNKRANFAGLRIHGLLTDLQRFEFYSYDPPSNEFCIDGIITVANKREPQLSDMIEGKPFTPCGSS
jgi:hypothetical protein